MQHVFCAVDILLPKNIDMALWPALACDQFTSQRDYWQQAQTLTQHVPSTLHLTLPEVYLEDADIATRIDDIHAQMHKALADVLHTNVHGFVYVQRTTESGTRCGIVGAIDLEAYSYEKGAKPLVRPSENTIVERIPPRLAVRRGASLELPHILMLLDDDKKSVIEPLATQTATLPVLYDTDLMLGGGHITGYAITDADMIETIETAVAQFATQDTFDAKYPYAKGQAPIALAVGDGNHSLATAKAYWQEVKQTLTEKEQAEHPARFALVELVNIHDDAMGVEPIHRVVFGTDVATVETAFTAWCTAQPQGTQTHSFTLIRPDKTAKIITVPSVQHPLCVNVIEAFLTDFCTTHKGASVDYIHGDDAVRSICNTQNAVGILLPDFAKSDLFRGVVLGGNLPKKTFSMGHAEEKRYYLESRKIIL